MCVCVWVRRYWRKATKRPAQHTQNINLLMKKEREKKHNIISADVLCQHRIGIHIFQLWLLMIWFIMDVLLDLLLRCWTMLSRLSLFSCCELQHAFIYDFGFAENVLRRLPIECYVMYVIDSVFFFLHNFDQLVMLNSWKRTIWLAKNPPCTPQTITKRTPRQLHRHNRFCSQPFGNVLHGEHV